MTKKFKKWLPHICSIGLMLMLLCIYFYPSLQGKVLTQSDVVSYIGMAHEANEYRANIGEEALWTNSMFSGMPTYQISLRHNSNLLRYINRLFRMSIQGPIGLFLAILLASYLGFIMIGLDWRIALICAIGIGFTTYFILLLKSGHHTKLNTCGYLTLIFTGVYLIFEKDKRLLGAAIAAFGMGMAITTNHVQMVYYFMFPIGLYILISFIQSLKDKRIGIWIKSFGVLLGAWVLGIACSTGLMWTTYEYQKSTIRGESILVKENNASAQTQNDGLDWDYATRWSNNFKDVLGTFFYGAAGGGYEVISSKGKLASELRSRGVTNLQFPLYWGGLNSTEGPGYIGAVLWTLLIFGMFYLPRRLQIWVLSSVVIVCILTMGKYATFFNRLLFDHFPFFDKFRAPGSGTTIIAIMVAIGAGLGFNKLVTSKKKKTIKKKYWKYGLYTLIGLIFFSLLCGLLVFDFTGQNDAQISAAGLMEATIAERRAFYFKSIFRTLLIGGLTAGIIYLINEKKIKLNYALLGIGLFLVFDLWGVDRRYLSSRSFINKNRSNAIFQPRNVDEFILKDTDPHFRVLDLSIDTYSAATTSYFHKTIGGYHAAKLRRYQDLIEGYLYKNHTSVLNMLNTKYIINPGKNNQLQVNPNMGALGNAWFVSNYIMVESANEEFNGLNGLDPANTALIHSEFAEYMNNMSFQKEGEIKLTAYSPNVLTYESNSPNEQLAVFSEVWYGPDKGWNAYVDGVKVDHIRANYILRALKVPGGNHVIEFRMEPKSYKIGSILSLIASGLVILLLFFLIFRDTLIAMLAKNE